MPGCCCQHSALSNSPGPHNCRPGVDWKNSKMKKAVRWWRCLLHGTTSQHKHAEPPTAAASLRVSAELGRQSSTCVGVVSLRWQHAKLGGRQALAARSRQDKQYILDGQERQANHKKRRDEWDRGNLTRLFVHALRVTQQTTPTCIRWWLQQAAQTGLAGCTASPGRF